MCVLCLGCVCVVVLLNDFGLDKAARLLLYVCCFCVVCVLVVFVVCVCCGGCECVCSRQVASLWLLCVCVRERNLFVCG